MAGQNRYLRGPITETFIEVRGNVVVEPGDFMFQFTGVHNLGTGWAPDNRAYPFTWARSASAGTNQMETVYADFLGVAMQGSIAGTTQKITIATDGVFKYPLYLDNSGVTVGASISAVSISTAQSEGVSKQTVFTGTDSPGSTAYLGICVKTQSGASFVDFRIQTKFEGLNEG